MTAADATRLAGEAYRTRLAHGEGAAPNDKTRQVQEGYQSKLAGDAAGGHPNDSEFYKVGEKIGGRYEVSTIHHGAMGVVYGCFDHQTKLPRALKTVRTSYKQDKQVLALFESEALVWISLEKHPYIVRAHRVERFENLPYVITEYVRGPEGMEGDLRGWLGHPRLTLTVAVSMALQIAQGMQHAVRKVPNLVHRDLKPANILVNGDGKAMVTDFGLVHAVQSDAGTPAYMSPEQWRAEALDARSDIYAYGCILFEMLTAHRLFPALAERDWELAHLLSTPAALTSIVTELPGEIDRFVRHCLEKEPMARPQSWDEVVVFFAEWYHRLTGNAVILDFSSLVLDRDELFSAGYSLQNIYRDEDAIQAYEKVLAIDPNCANAWSNIGHSLNNLNRHKEAISAYNRALAICPNDESILSGKGIALFNLERHENYSKLTPTMEQAEALRDEARKWLTVGGELKRLMRYEEAIKAYDRATIAPDCGGAWCGKGTCFSHLMRYEEAVQAFDQALAINQNSAFAWSSKGLALYRLERNEEAIQADDRALVIDPTFIAAWINKGLALDDLKRHEEALQAYQRALAIDPSSDAVWLYKGIALHNLKRYKEAIQVFDRVLVINPSDQYALQGQKAAKDALRIAE